MAVCVAVIAKDVSTLFIHPHSVNFILKRKRWFKESVVLFYFTIMSYILGALVVLKSWDIWLLRSQVF